MVINYRHYQKRQFCMFFLPDPKRKVSWHRRKISAQKCPSWGHCRNVPIFARSTRWSCRPNTKSRFWSKKNLNFETKIKILGFSTSLISSLMVSKSYSRGIEENDFQNLEIEFQSPKLKIEIEFQVLRC